MGVGQFLAMDEQPFSALNDVRRGLRAQVASFRDTAARRITDPERGRGFPFPPATAQRMAFERNTTVRIPKPSGRIALNIEDHKRPLISYGDKD